MNKVVIQLKAYVKRFYDPHDRFIKRLRKQGARVGKFVQIVDKGKFLYEPWCANLIEIGDEVVIAAGVRLVSHDSSYANIFGTTPTKYGAIVIEKKAYIGVNAVILPGVIIGESSLVGAGTIVNKDIPPRSIAVGNPCKIIGSVDVGLENYEKKRLSNTNDMVHFIDVGGSYAAISKKFGALANLKIMEIYQGYFNNKA